MAKKKDKKRKDALKKKSAIKALNFKQGGVYSVVI